MAGTAMDAISTPVRIRVGLSLAPQCAHQSAIASAINSEPAGERARIDWLNRCPCFAWGVFTTLHPLEGHARNPAATLNLCERRL